MNMAKNMTCSMELYRYYVYNCMQHVRRKRFVYISQVRHASALYLSSREANKTFSYLTPYLDFDNRFNDVEKLQEIIAARGMDMNAKELKKTWEFFKYIYAQKVALENRKTEIAEEVKKLIKIHGKVPKGEQDFEKLQIHSGVVKAELKTLKDTVSELEENIIPTLLKLPNEFDTNTPIDAPVVLKESGNVPDMAKNSVESHIEIGKNLGLLNYINPVQYYLYNEAALFELGLTNYAGKILEDHSFIKVVGSDFSRSIIVEATGLNHEDPMDTFTLKNNEDIEHNSPNRMHITGGASLASFLAMHTKQLINPKSFPLKYFSTGRQYVPLRKNVAPLGLFTACQAVVVHVFVAVKDSEGEAHKMQLDELIEITCKLYDGVCENYRVVVRPAFELLPSESMRISFEVWSQHLRRYIEVGYISTYKEYLSKRLLIAYQTSYGRDYPAVMSGAVISVPKLLGCLLEQNPDNFVIPEKIMEHMPIDFCTTNELK